MPWALTFAHRKLLFNRKGGHATLNEPGVSVTSRSGEEIKLEPLPEQPRLKKRPLAFDLINHMFKARDFSNLSVILEGFNIAHTPMGEEQLEMVIRKANQAEQTSMVIQAAEMVKKTGFELNMKRGSTRQLLTGIHLAAQRSEWKGEGLALALKQAEHVAKMMEWEEHKKLPPPTPEMTVCLPLQEQPEVIGLLLELTASRAANDLAGKDEDGKVKLYAERTLALWKNGNLEVHDGDYQKRSTALFWWLPLYNGLRIVKRVQLDKALKENLEEKRKLLEGAVLPVLDSLKKIQKEGRPPLWAVVCYDSLPQR